MCPLPAWLPYLPSLDTISIFIDRKPSGQDGMAYWIQFYLRPSRVAAVDVVDQAIQALLDSGCTYKRVRLFTTEDTSLPVERQRISVEEQSLDIEEAHSYPHAMLVFGFAFEFDNEVREMIARHGKGHLEKVTEIELSFIPGEDEIVGRRTELTLTTYEEYVLMYGKEETHERNRQRILGIAEHVYNRVNPYFGWMDGETNSTDESYGLLVKGRFPLGNEFVFIEKDLMKRANLRKLSRSGHWHKKLSNGGVVIRWAAKDRWGVNR